MCAVTKGGGAKDDVLEHVNNGELYYVSGGTGVTNKCVVGLSCVWRAERRGTNYDMGKRVMVKAVTILSLNGDLAAR